jgi:hypothetical protein
MQERTAEQFAPLVEFKVLTGAGEVNRIAFADQWKRLDDGCNLRSRSVGDRTGYSFVRKSPRLLPRKMRSTYNATHLNKSTKSPPRQPAKYPKSDPKDVPRERQKIKYCTRAPLLRLLSPPEEL